MSIPDESDTLWLYYSKKNPGAKPPQDHFCHEFMRIVIGDPIYSTSCNAAKPSSPVRTLTTFSTSILKENQD